MGIKFRGRNLDNKMTKIRAYLILLINEVLLIMLTIQGKFSWIAGRHEINENLNPTKVFAQTVY